MAFVIIGIILLALKLLEIGPVAAWSWWWILAPFAMAFLWWEIIDPMFSLSQKRAMRESDARRKARADKYRESLGLGTSKRKK